jgi:hypothetical protein
LFPRNFGTMFTSIQYYVICLAGPRQPSLDRPAQACHCKQALFRHIVLLVFVWLAL